MPFLRQSTGQTIRFGPFLDSTDGVTAETGLTIAQADRQISKDGAAFAQSNHTGNSTHDTDGWYFDDLAGSDTDIVGELILQVTVAGAVPVWEKYYVVEEAIYDALFAASSNAFTGAAGSTELTDIAAAAAQKIRDEILPTQNAAFSNLAFLFVSSGDHATPVTGATGMAVTRSIDGGAFGAGTGTGPAEVANGIYQYDASAADMNGGIIVFRFTGTGGTPAAPDDRFVTVVTGGGV